jgi:hypothetical protein
MKKSELRAIIKEVLKEELKLHESAGVDVVEAFYKALTDAERGKCSNILVKSKAARRAPQNLKAVTDILNVASENDLEWKKLNAAYQGLEQLNQLNVMNKILVVEGYNLHKDNKKKAKILSSIASQAGGQLFTVVFCYEIEEYPVSDMEATKFRYEVRI